MRIVALEEHVTLTELTKQIPTDAILARGFPNPSSNESRMKRVNEQLSEIGDLRIKAMNEAGITLQVLSVAGAGADLLDGKEGIALAYNYNNLIAEKIKLYPGRFASFAHLPMRSPSAAADELERTIKEFKFCGALINGLTEDQFLDNKKFAPLLEKAEQLKVPLYLHPGIPPKAVRQAYYEGLGPAISSLLGMAGIGWHVETAVHILRMILSGTLDKYPALQIIIGHMGETLPVLMARCDGIFNKEMTGRERTISETLQQQVYITTSGIFTNPPLTAAIQTFGIDRILFSVDYPFSKNIQGKNFLDNMPLAPEDAKKIASQNADRLLSLQ